MHVPARVLDVYAETLPRIQAEQHLDLLNLITAASSMQISEQSYRQIVRMLEQRAGAERPRPKATETDLSAVGIRVEHVPKKE